MNAWFTFPPLLAYAALVFAAVRFPSIGINAMAWFLGWLVVALAWLLFAAAVLQERHP